MMFGSTRVLIDAHMKECREHRERNSEQFRNMDKRIDNLNEKVDSLDEKSDRRHEENTDKLNKIMRYIWLAMGAFAAISFLLSHDGISDVIEFLKRGH